MEDSDSEKARPHALPPISKARGIDRMIEVRNTTEENIRKIHISAESAEGALSRTQRGQAGS
jgi:hypothetical protein